MMTFLSKQLFPVFGKGIRLGMIFPCRAVIPGHVRCRMGALNLRRMMAVWVIGAVVCSMVAVSHAESGTWAAAGGTPDVPYQTVDELRSFYKLMEGESATRKGAYTLSYEDSRVEFGPGAKELRINGMDISLVRPFMRDASGKLLISREDWVYWLDPILRPTYIRDPAKVETVVIDAAHGGHDGGNACGAAGSEAQVVLQIALALKTELEKAGKRCFLTRTGDYFLSDPQRVESANAVPNAIFVSLHLERTAPEAVGPSVYVLSPLPVDGRARPGDAYLCKSAALAYALQHALSAEMHAAGGGCRHIHYSLLSSVKMPAVSVQLGFFDNPQGSAQFTKPEYCTKLAVALAAGIDAFVRSTAPQAAIPTETPAPSKKEVKQTPKVTPRPTAARPASTKPWQEKTTKPRQEKPTRRNRRRTNRRN